MSWHRFSGATSPMLLDVGLSMFVGMTCQAHHITCQPFSFTTWFLIPHACLTHVLILGLTFANVLTHLGALHSPSGAVAILPSSPQ